MTTAQINSQLKLPFPHENIIKNVYLKKLLSDLLPKATTKKNPQKMILKIKKVYITNSVLLPMFRFFCFVLFGRKLFCMTWVLQPNFFQGLKLTNTECFTYTHMQSGTCTYLFIPTLAHSHKKRSTAGLTLSPL